MRRTVPRHAAHTVTSAARTASAAGATGAHAARTTVAGGLTVTAAARTALAVARRHPRTVAVAGLAYLALRPPRR